MKYLVIFLLVSFGTGRLYAQANSDAIKGVWVSENKKLKVEIYNHNNKYYGKIVWQYEQIDPETGKPKLDKENPDESKRHRPVMGLQVLKDFFYKDGFWQDGYVYNSQNGKTYACEMWLEGKDVIVVRGYWGIIYHTERWTRVKN